MLSPKCLPKPTYGPLPTVQLRNGFFHSNNKSRFGAAAEMVLDPLSPRNTSVKLKNPDDADYMNRVEVSTPKSKDKYDEITYYSMRSKSTVRTGRTGRTGRTMKSAYTQKTTSTTRNELIKVLEQLN